MSSAETSPPRRAKFVDVLMPYEMNAEFCDALTNYHGRENLRIMIQAAYFIAEYHNPFCRLKGTHRQYEKVWLDAPDSAGSFIDGRFLGARIIPLPKPDPEDPEVITFEYVPHAVIDESMLVDDGFTLTDNPHERIWVPLDGLVDSEKITFYD